MERWNKNNTVVTGSLNGEKKNIPLVIIAGWLNLSSTVDPSIKVHLEKD